MAEEITGDYSRFVHVVNARVSPHYRTIDSELTFYGNINKALSETGSNTRVGPPSDGKQILDATHWETGFYKLLDGEELNDGRLTLDKALKELPRLRVGEGVALRGIRK